MSLGRTLLRFTLLAAIGHQITSALVEGGVFDDARRRLSALDPRVDALVHCEPCVGTWVGALLAALYRPDLLADPEQKEPAPARQVVTIAADAVLIALGARVWSAALGWLRREVEVKANTADDANESEGIEVNGAQIPGISLRPERNPGRGLSRI